MAPSYSISGLGYNPLGTFGLGMTGTFSNYDTYMPSMLGMDYGLGMNNSIFGMNAMNSMYGMMGYPSYIAQMQQIQNQMQLAQTQHNGAMHAALIGNEVSAMRETDSALMQKILTNGDVQQGIQNLYEKVREGDQDAICQEFDKLKNYIFNTYRAEFQARGANINPDVSATQYMEAVYSQIISAQTNEIHDLRSDIKKYGDNSFQNGFMQGFRKGHHGRYVDETMNYCFGLPIDEKETKDARQTLGTGVGKAAHVAKIGTYGAIGSVAVTGTAVGLAKLVAPSKVKWLASMGKAWRPALLIGAALAVAGDIIWQCSSKD